MKRAILIVCVVAMVALAGCAGAGGNGDDPGEEADEPDEADADGEESETDELEGSHETDEDDSDGTDEADPPDESDEAGDEPDTTVDGELEFHHLDVGQADATLVVTPTEETILIDTGDWRQDGSEVIDYLESEGIDRIDHLVATHAHADHIGGHAAVIEHFETEGDGIGNVYDSGVPHTSQTYENYLDAVDDHGHELLLVEEGDELPIDDPDVDALVVNPPEGDSGDDLHYNSVSLALEFGAFEYVTTGDAEVDAEERMVDDWDGDLEADVYQAGHHGSSTSSTPTFVEAVDPEIAVVSSGYDSQYGHPHDEVLERLAQQDIETYWTAVHGDVVVTTDGERVDVETTAAFSSDPEDLLAEKPTDDEQPSIAPAIEGLQAPVAG